MTKILVIEDEPDMRYGLEHNLRFEGYDVYLAEDGAQGLEVARKVSPDLILLDIMLPGMSGMEVLERLRKSKSGVPIILVTAKSQEMDKIIGLETGADDYVTKPFSVKELLARISAVLRRFSVEDDIGVYEFGDIKLDFTNLEAKKGGKPIELTHREFEMMKLFIKTKGEIISRNVLLDKVWGYDGDVQPTTRTVDTHIAKLRKKIEDSTENPRWIITAHRVGYRFMG
ncbi:response regulator transcription factor [bacterium]|nr:response regulator transcription factor [bacterium]